MGIKYFYRLAIYDAEKHHENCISEYTRNPISFKMQPSWLQVMECDCQPIANVKGSALNWSERVRGEKSLARALKGKGDCIVDVDVYAADTTISKKFEDAWWEGGGELYYKPGDDIAELWNEARTSFG